MDVDFRGRVRNTPLKPSHFLDPLFEAISNSIHAIEEKQPPNGKIAVSLIRGTPESYSQDGTPVVLPSITGFAVEDDGVGFTEENFEAFTTSDTTRKQAKGGKGVGRFLWLKAFDRVSVDSVATIKDRRHRRTFKFTLTEKAIEAHKLVDANSDNAVTTVTLHDYKQEYASRCPKSTEVLARRIVQHFMELFVLGKCPSIKLSDEYDGTIDLKRVFDKLMKLDFKTQTFRLKGHKFSITHIRIAATHDAPHSIFLCANSRSVEAEQLVSLLPDLNERLRDEAKGTDFIYAGYISGKFLDDRVNPERSGFSIADSEEEPILDSDITRQDLINIAADKARTFLAQFIEPLKEKRLARIRQFIEEHAPQFRPLLKHKQKALGNIRANVSDEQLLTELFKVRQSWELELQATYKNLSSKNVKGERQQRKHREKFEEFLKQWNDVGIGKLAEYVVHRRATLSFLEERLACQEDGKYALEEGVHEIIFPLRKSSLDVPFDQMNLWILDERLAYHYYLASDQPLDKVEPIQVDSKERPDLLIFNRPFAFAENGQGPTFTSIVIVEFKRPLRDDYKSDENPIEQVFDYIRQIKDGDAKDRKGRLIRLSGDTPFYVYIVCDLTPTLRKQMEVASLHKTPDAMGYFGYLSNAGAYVEVISFDKLVESAKMRNRILFEKLGIVER